MPRADRGTSRCIVFLLMRSVGNSSVEIGAKLGGYTFHCGEDYAIGCEGGWATGIGRWRKGGGGGKEGDRERHHLSILPNGME